jgi:hypothetical protein
MSANVASFRDHKPGHLKHKLNQPAATPRAESILSDMADGNLATEFIFSFAGFKYAASHLVLTLIGVMGDGQDSIELADKDIAEIAECDTRTVQRWRKAYIEQAQKENFWPLEIKQGAYVKGEKYHLPSTYRVTFGETVGQIVAHARASADYSHDRISAIKKAAELYYDDIPQAPPSLRKRKPSIVNTPLAELNRAAKKLDSTQTLLQNMPERQRAAYVNGQGKELRAAMDRLRDQMAELEKALSGENANVDDKEDNYTNDNVVTPFSRSARPPAYVVPTEEEGTTLPEPTPEAIAAWDRTFACLNQPQVTRTNVEIVASATTSPPTIANLKHGQSKSNAPVGAFEAVTQAEAPPPELEYVPDAPEPTLTEFDAVAVEAETAEYLKSSDMKKSPKATFSEEDHAPPKSKMERDIEERGGTAHYF